MKKFAILMLMLAATCTFAVGCASTGGGGFGSGDYGSGACSSCGKDHSANGVPLK